MPRVTILLVALLAVAACGGASVTGPSTAGIIRPTPRDTAGTIPVTPPATKP